MVRSAAGTARFRRQLRGPFAGLVADVAAGLVGPLRLAECNNVYLRKGAILRRRGVHNLYLLSGAANLRIVNAIYFRVPAFYGSNAYLEAIVVKFLGTVMGGVGGIRVVSNGAGQLLFGDCSDAAALFETGSIDPCSFLAIPGSTVDDDFPDRLPVDLFCLDGASRPVKVVVNDNAAGLRIRPIGLSPPTAAAATRLSPGVSPYYESGQWEFAVSLCSRRFPSGDSVIEDVPLVEGNALEVPEKMVIEGGNYTIQLDITAPWSQTGQFWTHARLYVRNAVTETQYRFLAWLNRPHAENPPHTGDVVMTDETGDVWRAVLTSANVPAFAELPSGDHAYDYWPTRNYVPGKAHYATLWQARCWYARNDDALIWPSDIVGALTGGNYESVSGEFLTVPGGGPITLLANFDETLIVGTPETLYRYTGDYTSLDNRAVAVDEQRSIPGIDPDQATGGLGPVRRGPGAHVIVGSKLYFVSRYGLACYDGERTYSLSRDVWEAMRTMPTGFTASMGGEELLRWTTLHHDAERRIIFMTIRVPGTWASRPTDALNGYGVVWCYHYAEVDPDADAEAGIEGTWTVWRSFGGDQTLAIPRRVTAACVIDQPPNPPALAVSLIADGGSGLWDTTEIYAEYPPDLATSYADHDLVNDDTDALNVDWLAKFGEWDAELGDFKIHWYTLFAILKALAGETVATTYLKAYVNGYTKSRTAKMDRGFILLPVNMAAPVIAWEVGGSGQVPVELQGLTASLDTMGFLT